MLGDRRLTVATCIACGARSRGGECDDGCEDVPLDLVDAAEVDALAEHVKGLEARVGALRDLAQAVGADLGPPLAALREQARAALRVRVPIRDPDVRIVLAWGCPECGRVDAPQPCLGVCVRRPVAMADAGTYRRLAAPADVMAGAAHALGRLARLVAQVTPRPGGADATRDALRSRARALLAAHSAGAGTVGGPAD